LLLTLAAAGGCDAVRLGLNPPDRSTDAIQWLALAGAAHRDGAVDEAIVFARYAVAAAPDNPQTYLDLAGYRHAAGEFAAAVAAYEQALKRAPALRDAYIGLGWALLNLGRVSEALTRTPIAGRHFDELHLRGALQLASGEIAAGTALLREAKAMADRNPGDAPLAAVRDIDCRLVGAAGGNLVCPLGPVRPGTAER